MKKISLIILFFILSTVSVYAENKNEYEKLISYIDLSLPQLLGVKSYADIGDYESAAREFINYYSQRKTPVWSEMPKKPGNNTNYNTVDADNIKNLLFDYNGELISVDNGDGSINWTLKPGGEKEWMWALNRQFQFVTLSRAYVNTGDISYAEAFEKQFNDWYENNPKPSELDTDGTWRTLEAGIRIGSSMISYFNNFVMSDDVSLLTKARILISLHEHGEYLSKYSGTNNWLLMESKGFYSLVYMFPEFKNSKSWKSIIFDRLETDFSNQFLDDGWQHELTPNYHIESVKSIAAIQDMANKNGDNLPYAAMLLKSYTSAQAIMGAGMFILPLNDTHDVNQSDFMYEGASLSDSLGEDLAGGFIASASGGLYGEKDLIPGSAFYQNSGYMVMRDGNDKNSISALFETGASGIGGHGWMSRDKLQLTLTAFDRDLLIDTGGSTTYGDDPLSQYTYTTPAHNTVTIDGYDQVRRTSDAFSPQPETKFITSDKLEYAQGIYDEKYSETELIDVVHKRRVAFVKSEYLIVRDELSGNGNHTARQYWNLAPGKYVMDDNTGIVRTDFDDGKNVMIIPVNFNGKESGCGVSSPMRGWTSTGSPTLNFCYKNDFIDFGEIETVIIPYKEKIAPEVRVWKENGKIKIEYKNFTDTVDFEGETVSVERTYYDGNSEIIDFSSEAEAKTKDYSIIPCSGTIQSEWSGFEKYGAQYSFDSSARGKSTVTLNEGAYQILRIQYGLTSLKVRAKGGGILKINDTELEINSDSFQDYTVYGINGGNIKVMCVSGSVAIDQYSLNGGGESINMQALRCRLPQLSQTFFAQSSAEVNTMSVDFTPISSLSAVNTSYFGFKFGDYQVRYNMTDNQAEIYCNNSLVIAQEYYLNYGNTYNLALRLLGSKIILSIDGKDVISANYNYVDGTTAIIASDIDIYADNATVNGLCESYEGKTAGTLSESDSKWIVEGIENQYEDFEIICSTKHVLPGTEVTIQLNNANGAVLLKNGEEVPYVGNEYTFTAYQGVYTFCLKSENRVSKPVEIASENDFYEKSAYLTEKFNKTVTDNKWEYNENYFIPLNGKWYMRGVKNVQAEAYTVLPAAVKNKVSIECNVIPDSDLSNVKLFVCRDSFNRELQPISFAEGGKIIDTITKETIGNYTPGVSNRVKVDMDLDKGTYTVYNNGILLSRDRKMSSYISDIKRIYAAIIWNGKSGTYLSDFQINELADLDTEINVKSVVEESEVFSQKLKFKNKNIYSAQYQGSQLVSLNTLSDNGTLNLNSSPITLFDWDNMIPYLGKTECYFSLTPGFDDEGYFCQNFNNYNGGMPSSRWGGSVDYLSADRGMIFIDASISGTSELYYNCLDTLKGKVSIEADIVPETNKTKITLFTYRDETGAEAPMISYDTDGKIYSSAGKLIGTYTPGEKNKIRLEIDTVNRVYNLWVDGVIMSRNIPIEGNSSGIKRIYLAKIYKGISGVSIDNFVVSTIR